MVKRWECLGCGRTSTETIQSKNINKARNLFLQGMTANKISGRINIHRSTILRWMEDDLTIIFFKIRVIQLHLEVISNNVIATELCIAESVVEKFLKKIYNKKIFDLPRIPYTKLVTKKSTFDYHVFYPTNYYPIYLQIPDGHLLVESFIDQHTRLLKSKRAIQLYMEGLDPMDIAHLMGWGLNHLNNQFNLKLIDHICTLAKYRNEDEIGNEYEKSKKTVKYSAKVKTSIGDIVCTNAILNQIYDSFRPTIHPH